MIFNRFSVLISVLILAQFASQFNCLMKTYFALNQWYENPKIWSAKRLPCSLDTVILPENLALYLKKPISASKIILPKNGILILDQKNWINKSNDYNCDRGQDNKLRIRQNDWFDTNSWIVNYQMFNYRGYDQMTNPVPHINRIPCEYDDVRFGVKSTFKVSIDSINKNYKLKSLIINNKKIISRDFERYTQSKIGKLQFNIIGQMPFYVIYNDHSIDRHIQMCTNNLLFFYNKICRTVIDKCPILNCVNAIRPTGFCCDLCGSLISLEHIDNTMDSDFIESVLSNIHADKYEDVNYFLSRITDNKVEIILLNSEANSRKFKKMAQDLIDLFKRDNFYQLRKIEHLFSVYYDEKNNTTQLLIAFILFSIVSILIFVYYDNLKRNLSPAINQICQQFIFQERGRFS